MTTTWFRQANTRTCMQKSLFGDTAQCHPATKELVLVFLDHLPHGNCRETRVNRPDEEPQHESRKRMTDVPVLPTYRSSFFSHLVSPPSLITPVSIPFPRKLQEWHRFEMK